MQQNKYIIFILFLIIFLSGCASFKQKKFKNDIKIDYYQEEARFSDIPILLDSEPLNKVVSENSFAYQTKETKEDIVLFYKSEMEVYGWRLISEYSGFEDILLFEKPSKKF